MTGSSKKQNSPRRVLRAKGSTPAGTHIPVLLQEVEACLKPANGKVVVDCTVGYGGHSRAFARRIAPDGKLIALDMDQIELEKTRERLSNEPVQISFYRSNFSDILSVLHRENLPGADIIFADIGVSSMQIDQAQRGISYRHKGILDLRMDTSLENTGTDLVNSLSQDELSKVLWEFSDEPDHEEIAAEIIKQRAFQPITQISQLVRVIFRAKGLTLKTFQQQNKSARFGTLHPAARTFQALRILVNDELASLEKLLKIAPECLNSGGRIGIISFHSGEDRLVKQYFRKAVQDGVYTSAAQNPISPRYNEIRSNPRSASAKFRWAIKS